MDQNTHPETDQLKQDEALVETDFAEQEEASLEMDDSGQNGASAKSDLSGQSKTPKKKWLPYILVMLAILLGAGIWIGTGDMRLYASAQKDFENGAYAAAREKFTKLEDYPGAKEHLEECGKFIQYDEGVALMQKGNYREALRIFTEISDIKDASALIPQCKDMIAYNEAVDLMNTGDYQAAMAIFETIPKVKDSARLIEECKKGITFLEAKELFDLGKYTESQTIFSSLGDFQDAASYVSLCTQGLNCQEAENLAAQGQYEKAEELLTAAKNSSFPKADQLLENLTSYKKGMEYFKDQQYYKAASIFKKIPHFSDSSKKLEQCPQSIPNTGVLHRNSAYSGKSLTLNIHAPSGNEYLLLKIKKGTDTVASIFMHPGKIGTIKLPSGSYTMDYGYGKTWYGLKDAFGKDGYYGTLVNGGSPTFSLSSGYIYDLQMRVSGPGNVGRESKSWDGF